MRSISDPLLVCCLAWGFVLAPRPGRAAPLPPDVVGSLWSEGRHTGEGPLPSLQNFARLARSLGPAVVNIQTLQIDAEALGQPGRRTHTRGQGTGFIIHKKGYVLTNHHVVEGTDEIQVRLADDRLLPARVVGSDEHTDVALLKIDAGGDLPVAPLGDSEKIDIGEWVIAIGNPFGLDHTVTAGIISGKGRRDVRPGGSTAGFFDFIQTDASINAGNSGGPLINAHGEVIGINTAMNAQAQGIAFAIPINMVKSIVPLLREHGRAPRAWLGLSSQPVTASLRTAFALPDARGALVSDVTPGSPAAEAGIVSGDVIVEFDGRAIRRADDLDWLVTTAGAGRSVPIALRHDGAIAHRKVTPVADPSVPDHIPPLSPGKRHHSPLGMVVSEVGGAEAGGKPSGVVVVQVEPGSPASEANLERGDVLLRIGEAVIGELEDYAHAVRTIPRGAIIKLLVKREGKHFWAAFEKR